VPTGCQFQSRSGPHWITRQRGLCLHPGRRRTGPDRGAVGRYGIGTDPYGDLFVLQAGLGHVVSQLQEVAATGTSSIPAAVGQVSSLYPLTSASGGITVTQPDGAQVAFEALAPGGGCPAPFDVAAGR
jgi:hypothetical protein